MNDSKKEDPLKYFAVAFLGFPLLLGILIAVAGVTPTGPEQELTYNFTSMHIALALGIVLWLSTITHRFSKKNTWWSWLTHYFVSITFIPVLIGITSLNLVYASFPSWKWIVPLGAMYVIAAILPFINEKLSEILHTEIFAPRTCLGRIFQISILALAPAAGSLGAHLSGAAQRVGGVMGYSVLGLIFHFFFVWGTASMAHQSWDGRPWKTIKEE
jgi:hypothetical protein